MSTTSYLRALLKRDLSAIRRVLFQQPLLEKTPPSDDAPPTPPDRIDRDAGDEQEGAANGVSRIGANGSDHDVQSGQEEEDQGSRESGKPEA